MQGVWWSIIKYRFLVSVALLVVLFWNSVSTYCQDICTGTFGVNIFDGGDFGRGVANIVPQDTSFAPGYAYTTSTTPMDGFYTITNDMGRRGNNYGTWINTGDASDDPLGYIM